MKKMAFDDTKVDGSDDILAADWNAMVTDQKTRAKTNAPDTQRGSEGSLTNGVKLRVFTLTNTALTSQVQVFRNGAHIHPSDITITHNASSSTVRLDNIEVYDLDYLTFYYFT